MKKSLIALTLAGITLVLPVLAFAQPVQIGSIDQLITSLQSLAWKVFGIVALICFVVAGILFLTSAGNPEKVSAARSAFMWGIAGIIVGILAYSIITIIQNLL